MVVLFNNGSGDCSANATTASVADGQDVNGFHGFEAMGKEGGSSPKKLGVPAFNLGNDVVAGFVEAGPEGAVAAHHEATIFPLAEGCHGGEQKLITRLGFADEGRNDGKELVLEEGGGHG